MKITTLPVYSKLADEADVRELGLWEKLPVNEDGSRWRLSQHQVDTYRALTQGDYDVIFNTAMTGDGKSLAAYLRALRDGDHVIAMYPSNELIRDQVTRVYEYSRDWKSPVRFQEMYGSKISELMEFSYAHSRVEQVRRLLEQNAILLTNPDLFHLMMNFKYGRQAWERKELPFEVPANFDYFLFDEFHVFGIPQIVNVVNAINYLAVQHRGKPTERKRFLFLSATPHPLMMQLLHKSGIRVIEVIGSYQNSDGEQYRPILQPCDLHFQIVDRERNAEVWVKENLKEIIQCYRDDPASKGAIIVNSAAAARRLRIWLSQNLPPDITVSENTGLTGRDERLASFEKKLLIGTSTVDIGIDFRINLLIFEATDSGTFIQRFGRLGRHTGFHKYRAYALLPKFLVERFAQEWPDGGQIDRPIFTKTVREVFPTEQQFSRYKSRWGVMQTAHLLAQTERSFPQGSPLVDDLIVQFNRAFDRSNDKGFEHLVKQYWAKMNHDDGRLIIDELTSFRGQSPLSCGLWDLTDGELKTYDLFFILGNTQFEVVDEEKFMEEVHHRGLPEYAFRRKLLYVKIWQYKDEREDYVLGLKRDLINHDEWLHTVQAFKGFFIKDSRQPWISAVNRALQTVRLVCVISDKKAADLKRKLYLPLLFPVYRLWDLYDSEYSVAFGQQAFLLESLLFYQKTSQNSAIIT